jgi:rhamnulokinase
MRMLACDLGAESGRAVVGAFDGERLTVEEVHRFPNQPVMVGDTLCWDVLRLYADVVDSIRAAGPIASAGIDTWGVDFALLDRAGHMIGNPVHYRDRRTDGVMELAFRRVSRETIYRRTGIQHLPINTLYQLLAMASAGDPQLAVADRLLTMPALLSFWLCGVKADELTDATTTQCYDPIGKTWALDLVRELGVPDHIFGEIVPPGTELGSLAPGTGAGGARLIAPGTHDTASAVAAVPFVSRSGSAYISSGTWSLVGIELDHPLINDQTLDCNLTNEGGVAGTFRLLRNVMGLWLLQECMRAWTGTTLEQLLASAVDAPRFRALVDPDDERLLRPGDMPSQLAALAAENGMVLDMSPASVVRCILESLALKYRWVIDQLERITDTPIHTIHVVGGGARNRVLCQMTADAAGRRVHAGPVEATAIGNVMVQAIALGLVGSLAEAREMIRRSAKVEVYEPVQTDQWEAAWERLVSAPRLGAHRRPA